MRYSDITYAGDAARGDTALADLPDGTKRTVSATKRYRHKNSHPVCVLTKTSVLFGTKCFAEATLGRYRPQGVCKVDLRAAAGF